MHYNDQAMSVLVLQLTRDRVHCGPSVDWLLAGVYRGINGGIRGQLSGQIHFTLYTRDLLHLNIPHLHL